MGKISYGDTPQVTRIKVGRFCCEAAPRPTLDQRVSKEF